MKSLTTLPLSEKVIEWQNNYQLSDNDCFALMSAEYELDRFNKSRFAGSPSLTHFKRDIERFESELDDLIDGDWEFNPPKYPTEVYKSLRHRMDNLEAFRTFFDMKLPKFDQIEEKSAQDEKNALRG